MREAVQRLAEKYKVPEKKIFLGIMDVIEHAGKRGFHPSFQRVAERMESHGARAFSASIGSMRNSTWQIGQREREKFLVFALSADDRQTSCRSLADCLPSP